MKKKKFFTFQSKRKNSKDKLVHIDNLIIHSTYQIRVGLYYGSEYRMQCQITLSL